MGPGCRDSPLAIAPLLRHSKTLDRERAMQPKYRRLCSLLAAALLCAPALHAKPFKWSSQGDVATWYIHAQNNALQNGIHGTLYESLVSYDSKTFAIEPLLATSWKEISPTQMRFTLRQGVRFHEGSARTDEDVVFSLQRAMAKTSQYTPYTQGISRAAKVDERTVDVFLTTPNPVLLRQMTELRIMSRAWAEKNKSTEPEDMKSGEEIFAHRNAMGTGPYTLESWQPDVKMVFKRYPGWWGKMDGNVTEIVYLPIKSAPTRIAALLSGEVDIVLYPPADKTGPRALGGAAGGRGGRGARPGAAGPRSPARQPRSEGDRRAGIPHHLPGPGPVAR